MTRHKNSYRDIACEAVNEHLNIQCNSRRFLLDELENRLAIHSWECSDTDYNSTDFGCLLLQVSFGDEDEATF